MSESCPAHIDPPAGGSAGPPPALAAGLADVELRSGRAIALDVRERREYESGTIPGARYLPLRRLDPSQLEPGRRYITFCATGSRSGAAARALRDAGLDVFVLAGGLDAWRRLGLPVTSRPAR